MTLKTFLVIFSLFGPSPVHAEECTEQSNQGMFNYTPSIEFKDKNNAWVMANTLSARTKKCINSCQKKFGKEVTVLWRAKKGKSAPAMIGWGQTEISPAAMFECSTRYRKSLKSGEMRSISRRFK